MRDGGDNIGVGGVRVTQHEEKSSWGIGKGRFVEGELGREVDEREIKDIGDIGEW